VLILLAAVAALAILVVVPTAGAVGASSSQASVRVHPATGGPRTAFTITVRIPAQTGTSGVFRRSDTVTATGPSRKGCAASAEAPLPAAAAGSTVRVRMVPGRRSAHWCTGTFRGVVTQSQSTTCGGGGSPHLACPMLMIRPQTIGRFRFRVRRG